ncbi:HNH endonuclease [Microbacterium sp. Root166]|uniref:HNH endonuclease signature motif containing protein n=1 Tax=Microbacterium sp. Root166 TaxID=1736478 RepID=UPI0006F7221D|nr:HNH endonuclease signature motif containing protein [Microbacterium sp. Root166]KQZ84541.1 HNH endonuclease [Microbacterium sp. Root166]
MTPSDDDSFAADESAVWDAEPVDDAGWYVDGVDAAPVPDDVDRVTEVADMMAVFAAQRVLRVEALRRNALDDAARYGGAIESVVDRSVRLELAAALRVTEHAAASLLGFAEALVHRYPAALDSLGRAGMTERHAEILVDLLDSAEPDVRKRLVPRAVELAGELAVGSFRRALRRLVELEQSATLAERHEAALQGRRVVVEPAGDGMAWIHSLGPEVEAHAIYNRLTAKAKAICAHPDETRTLDQVRADIFGDLLIDGDTAHLAPEARGIRATVAVTVPVLTLLDESQAADAAPAVVEGLGPIPLAKARELAGGADGWTRILTHPETGVVLSVGRDQYRPPPALRRLARWRADRCMAPGCGIPAARCEIDHTIAWEHGGPTALDNLAPLCKGHHTIKHHGGWQVEQVDGSGGALHWTSPSGRHYTVHPERRVPVFRAAAETAPAPF